MTRASCYVTISSILIGFRLVDLKFSDLLFRILDGGLIILAVRKTCSSAVNFDFCGPKTLTIFLSIFIDILTKFAGDLYLAY